MGAKVLLEIIESNSSAYLDADRRRVLDESTRDSFTRLPIVPFERSAMGTDCVVSCSELGEESGPTDCIELKDDVMTGVHDDMNGALEADVRGV